MYRVFLISLFNLLHLCFASGYHSDYSSSSSAEYDERFWELNDDDVDKIDYDDDRIRLMGLDYYNGGDGSRNEDLIHDTTQLQMAGPGDYGGDRDYGSEPNTKGNIVVLDSQDARNYKAELLAGNKADVLDANPNHYQPDTYPDFGRRRSVPPFIDVTRTSKNDEADEPVPVWAPPEMVIAIAKESALLNAAEIKNPTNDLITKDILRTGNYWNAFWTDEVNPQLLREKNEKQLDTMKVEVRPQSEMYDLIVKLKQFSPKLLYVVNKK